MTIRWSVAGMAENAGTPARSVKSIDYLELALTTSAEHHLGDPQLPRVTVKTSFAWLYQNHLDLAAVNSEIDRPGGVEERDAVLDRETLRGRIWPRKPWECDDHAGGNQHPLPRLKRDGCLAAAKRSIPLAASVWYCGSGKPSNEQGFDLDFYFVHIL